MSFESFQGEPAPTLENAPEEKKSGIGSKLKAFFGAGMVAGGVAATETAQAQDAPSEVVGIEGAAPYTDEARATAAQHVLDAALTGKPINAADLDTANAGNRPAFLDDAQPLTQTQIDERMGVDPDEGERDELKMIPPEMPEGLVGLDAPPLNEKGVPEPLAGGQIPVGADMGFGDEAPAGAKSATVENPDTDNKNEIGLSPPDEPQPLTGFDKA